MVSLGGPVTYDVITTAIDVIITAHFLVISPLYFLLLGSACLYRTVTAMMGVFMTAVYAIARQLLSGKSNNDCGEWSTHHHFHESLCKGPFPLYFMRRRMQRNTTISAQNVHQQAAFAVCALCIKTVFISRESASRQIQWRTRDAPP